MNYSWLLFPLLLADGKGLNQSNAVEAMLTSSNQIPETPRLLLAVTQAKDQADRQEQQQKAATQREVDLANLIKEAKLTVPSGTDLSGDPRMLYMLSKLSDPILKASVGKILDSGTVATP